MSQAQIQYEHETPASARLWAISWPLIIVVTAIAAIGTAMLYSVAGGSFDPWAAKHAARFILGLGLLFGLVLLPLRFLMGLAYPLYAALLVLLLAVFGFGIQSGGAARWLAGPGLSFQPAELAKVAVVLALARYFQWVPHAKLSRPLYVLVPLAIVFVPAVLIAGQPDLGTAALLVVTGSAMIFLAGVSIWYGLAGVAAGAAATPFVWSLLRDYQKERLLNFLDPERDPLGQGYQIFQSKIALGSGGESGKGFMRGTQSQLDFLPEKHTDFIFTILGEELGFIGTMSLLVLYAIVLALLLYMSLRCRSQYARVVIAGTGLTLFFHLFVNVGMVMGLLPVVGAPLPLVSYGGSSLIATMVLLGLAMNAFANRREQIQSGTVNRWV